MEAKDLLRQNRVEIDLDCIRHNYRILADALPADVRVMAVVKANAYGHGIVEVSKAVVGVGARDLAVAIPEEGIKLRENGVSDATILVLGAATEPAAEPAVRYGLTQTVFEPHMVEVLEETAQRVGKPALVHIKLDTGMGRIGLRSEGEADALRLALEQAPHVKATGIYTHFSDADNVPVDGGMNEYTRSQLSRFLELKAHFDPNLPAHVSNSAMCLIAPEAYFSMVREGISLYGYPPVPTSLAFQPALAWKTEITCVKDIKADDNVGYGRAYTAQRDMRVATVAVGYGDGYHRAASNRGQMLVGGRRVNILGRVCMDQTMVDVSDVPNVKVGDEAVLIGCQGGERISAGELADWAGTISYEVLLAVTDRVERVYLHA